MYFSSLCVLCADWHYYVYDCVCFGLMRALCRCKSLVTYFSYFLIVFKNNIFKNASPHMCDVLSSMYVQMYLNV